MKSKKTEDGLSSQKEDKKEDKKDKGKKNTSLRLDKKTLKELKILAIEKETSIQKLIESLIKDYLEKHKS